MKTAVSAERWRGTHYRAAYPEPVGNSLAIVALVSMVCVVALTVYRLNKEVTVPVSGWWAIPLLTTLGLGIMLYLASIPETLICYPSGACQVIQQSEYGKT